MIRVEVVAGKVAAAFGPVLAASGFDQDSAHCLRGGGEEVPTTVPAMVIAPSDQPKVCLVHQGGRLERMVGRLGGHARGGELPQLVVDEGQKVGGSRSVASRRGIKEARDLGHSAEYNASGRQRNEKSGDHDVAFQTKI